MSLINELLNFEASEISDALDSLGVDGAIKGIRPLVAGQRVVGPVYTVQYEPYPEKPDGYQRAGDYIDEIPEGAVVMIDNQALETCTVWGSLLTATAIQKNLAGTIVLGVVRDVLQIKALNYPVFSLGTYMKSGKNRVRLVGVQKNIEYAGILIQPDDVVFADEHGVLVIPDQLVEEVIHRASAIRKTEECILMAIKEGMTLKAARKKYHYHKPWLKHHDA